VRSFAAVLFLFILSLASMAQTEDQKVIDSLESLLKKSQPDSQRLKIINSLAYRYADINTERFVELAEESLGLIENTKDKSIVGNVYMNMGLATEARGEYTSSLAFNAKALQIFQTLGDTIGISSILNNIGIAYNQMGDYSMAVYYLLKAAELDEARKDTVGATIDYINLSESYYGAKSYEVAIQWAKKAFVLLSTEEGEFSKGYAAEMLAMACIEINKFDSAKQFISISKTLAEKYNNEYLVNRNTGHMGRMHLKMNMYDSARYYLTKTIQQSEGKHLADVLLPAILNLSRCYLAEEKYPDALAQAQAAYKSSLEIKNKIIALESCKLIGVTYERMNKKDEAIVYLKLASDYQEKIMEQSIQGSIQAKTFDVTLEKEKKEKQAVVDSLEQSGKVLVRQRNLLITVVVVAFILLALLYLLRKINVERKNANEQLTQNNIQLNKLNQEINGLIHTIVHDLKSPLNSLQGILFILEPEVKNNPGAMEMIKHAHKALTNGHDIIKELLELRELEEKPLSLQLETISLKRIIEEIVSDHLPYADQKKIQLRGNAPDVNVQLDKQIMKRLITNLVSNAIKFSPKEKPVFINALTTDRSIVFEIIDQGPGFKTSDIEKMYAKFQRLSATPTGGESSHGLGLAIVDLLVKRLGATIDLKTEYGKGSAFIVTIPVTA